MWVLIIHKNLFLCIETTYLALILASSAFSQVLAVESSFRLVCSELCLLVSLGGSRRGEGDRGGGGGGGGARRSDRVLSGGCIHCGSETGFLCLSRFSSDSSLCLVWSPLKFMEKVFLTDDDFLTGDFSVGCLWSLVSDSINESCPVSTQKRKLISDNIFSWITKSNLELFCNVTWESSW